VLDDWDRALDANGSALDAVESMKVYDDGELLWHRQRLRDERRWLTRVRHMGAYDPLPRLSAHPQNPDRESAAVPSK